MQVFLTVLYKKTVKIHHFAPYHGCNLQPPHLSILLLTECHFGRRVLLEMYQIIEVSQSGSSTG